MASGPVWCLSSSLLLFRMPPDVLVLAPAVIGWACPSGPQELGLSSTLNPADKACGGCPADAAQDVARAACARPGMPLQGIGKSLNLGRL